MFNALEAAKSHSHVLLFSGILRELREGQRGYRDKDSFPSTVSFLLFLFKLLSVNFFPKQSRKEVYQIKLSFSFLIQPKSLNFDLPIDRFWNDFLP